MSARGAQRMMIAGLLCVAASQAAPADLAPGWSARFADAGFSHTNFERGPVCLLTHRAEGEARLYVGGEFSSVGGEAHRSLVAFDGANWSGVDGLASKFGFESVAMMTSMPIGGAPRVVLVGQFNAPGTLDGLAYVDGEETIRAFPPGPRTPHAWFGSAFAWESPTGPELTLGSGLFPQGSEYIYRYREQGGFGLMSPGVITITTAYAVFDDGSGPALYIGVPRVGAGFNQTVTRWDGATMTSLPAGVTWVNALSVYDDGDGPALYAAGIGVKRYRAGAWETIAGAPSGIAAMAVFDDGRGPALYVAGRFTMAGGQPATNIARYRQGSWEALGQGLAGGQVNDLEVFDEDGPIPPALYAVGEFTHAGGVHSAGVARWGVETCPADYNVSGAADSQDFFDFLAAFFAGAADFNRDGASDSQDLFDFLDSFFEDC